MKSILFVLLFFISTLNLAQSVSGTVTTKKGEALSFATVYLANTDIGTISDIDGKYYISNIPPGKYDLVASFVGYNTDLISIEIEENSELQHNFSLQESSMLLDEIEVVADLKVRKRYLEIFRYHFIGNSEFSNKCKIQNEDAIYFRKNEESGMFDAYADEPIEVVNKNLGYKIYYELYQFRIDEKAKILYMYGIPRFEELNSNPGKKIIKNREKAYDGSLISFFRALHDSDSTAEFQVRKLYRKKIPIEKNVSFQLSSDPTKAPDLETKYEYKDSVGAVLPISDIVFYDQFDRCFLKGDKYFVTSYINALKGYAPSFEGPKRNPNTKLFILQNQLEIFENGRVGDATKIYVEGYWMWSEKLANLIPSNYNPK